MAEAARTQTLADEYVTYSRIAMQRMFAATPVETSHTQFNGPPRGGSSGRGRTRPYRPRGGHLDNPSGFHRHGQRQYHSTASYSQARGPRQQRHRSRRNHRARSPTPGTDRSPSPDPLTPTAAPSTDHPTVTTATTETTVPTTTTDTNTLVSSVTTPTDTASIDSMPSLVTINSEQSVNAPLDEVTTSWLNAMVAATMPNNGPAAQPPTTDIGAMQTPHPDLPFQEVSPSALEALLSVPAAVTFTDDDVVMGSSQGGPSQVSGDEAVDYE